MQSWCGGPGSWSHAGPCVGEQLGPEVGRVQRYPAAALKTRSLAAMEQNQASPAPGIPPANPLDPPTGQPRPGIPPANPLDHPTAPHPGQLRALAGGEAGTRNIDTTWTQRLLGAPRPSKKKSLHGPKCLTRPPLRAPRAAPPSLGWSQQQHPGLWGSLPSSRSESP
ncbi:unnamed protein product [Caretta caretta]